MKNFIIERRKTWQGMKWMVLDREGSIARTSHTMCVFDTLAKAQQAKVQMENLYSEPINKQEVQGA